MYYVKMLWPLFGTYLTLWGVIISLKQKEMGFDSWHIILLSVGLVFFLYICYERIISDKTLRYKKKKSNWQAKVKEYMYSWIKNGNRVAIYSHDLSWVDENMKQLLCQKANKNELLICLPEYNELTTELESKGAEILTYGDKDYMPDSRFTIVNYGTGTPSVAIAHFNKEEHVIEECSAGDHPAVFVASDLVSMIKKYSDKMKATSD